MEGSYRVKIEGRLLEDEKNDDETDATEDKKEQNGEAQKSTPQLQKPRFSHFFKSLTVDFDPSQFRNGADHTVEWKKPETNPRNTAASLPAAADFDEFTFKRNGDENQNITINLWRQETPEKYQLSPELADVVDMKEATQQDAVMGLWEYIKLLGLQEDEEKRNFRCDEPLRKESLDSSYHLQNTNSINLDHTGGHWTHPHANRLRDTASPSSGACQAAIHHPGRPGFPQRPPAHHLRYSGSSGRSSTGHTPATS